tara:strand:- start:961 stop:1407 length:447 start_codon:yes stop_codon:yes gene_type:complete
MAKLKYKGREKRRSLIKSMSVKSGETIDINPIHALSYLGADEFEIHFEDKDKEALKKCSRGQSKLLKKEFGGAGLEETLKLMYPEKKKSFKPKLIKEANISNTKLEEVKEEKIKKEIKPVSSKKIPKEKKEVVKTSIKTKKTIKDSQL